MPAVDRPLTGRVRASIGLGANLPGPAGSPAQTLAAAIAALDALPEARLVGRSRIYVSDPVDADGPPYLNQAVRIETAASAGALLAQLQAIEQRFGRQRSHRNAPRTLDLDLLLFGDRRIDEPGLQIPHPRLQQRLFVLMPLADIDPGQPVTGLGTVGELLAVLAPSTTQCCRALT